LPIYVYSLYILIDILITIYVSSISSDNNNLQQKNDYISPDIINSVQCISILVFSPIVAYKLNFKKIYNIIYDIYFSDTNEKDSYSQNDTVNQIETNVKRLPNRFNRDNPNFALSSIKFI